MRDLSGTFLDGGSMVRPSSAAICLPDGKFGEDIVTFAPECFDPNTGEFRPEVVAWLRALADGAALPFGGMA